MSAVVEFLQVSKTFGSQRVVNQISFSIQPGEFFSLLGPSGCGKTTTLRLLAGFEQPDADGGQILIQEKLVNALRPYDRNLGMVFQNYALFPHLTIERNIAFGLEQRGVPKAEIARKVLGAMELVRLDPATFAKRVPSQLSGGQRQRVALARALVLEPPILLLDEPLGALDLKLRKEMQLELKAMNRKLGITFVYVTHDQEEALTMSDRIAVMDRAQIAQLGSPAEIYEHPRTEFVARFIGESSFVEGELRGQEGKYGRVLRPDGSSFLVPTARREGKLKISLRPERLRLGGMSKSSENALHCTVQDVIYRGESLFVRVTPEGGGELTVSLRNEGQLKQPVAVQRGDKTLVIWSPEDGHVLEEV